LHTCSSANLTTARDPRTSIIQPLMTTSSASAASAAASKQAEEVELHIQQACTRVFGLINEGNVRQVLEGTLELKRLLRQHPSHPLPHYVHVRIAHKMALEQTQSGSIKQPFDECYKRAAAAARVACPHSIVIRLLFAEVCFDTLQSLRDTPENENWWACCDSASPANRPTPTSAAADFKHATVGRRSLTPHFCSLPTLSHACFQRLNKLKHDKLNCRSQR